MENKDYSQLTAKELYEAYNNLDKEKYPEEAQKILEEIFRKEKLGKALPDQDLAGRGTRLGALIIDSLIVIVPGFIFLLLLIGTDNFIQRLKELTLGYPLLISLGGLLVYLAVNGWLLYKYGQTVGKRGLDIKIVDLNGNVPPLYKTVLIRNIGSSLIASIPFIGSFYGLADALFIFGKERRCLHDLLAGTRVVNA